MKKNRTSIETMRALTMPAQDRTEEDRARVLKWANARARTMLASPEWSAEGWLRLRTELDVDVDALAALIVDAVDGHGALDFIADDDDGRADWSNTDLVDQGWRNHDGRGMVHHELGTDTSLAIAGTAVPAVLKRHARGQGGQVKGRRALAVGGDLGALVETMTDDQRSRWQDVGTLDSRDLVAMADALMADDPIDLMGTDEYAWSEMTPPLSGDVRIDVDGATPDPMARHLRLRADVISTLATLGALDQAAVVRESERSQYLADALTQRPVRKPAYSCPAMGATSKVDGRKAAKLPRVHTWSEPMVADCPASLAMVDLVRLPNVISDGRTVWTFNADGSALVERVESLKARKARERREHDRERKATVRAAVTSERSHIVELLDQLTEQGQTIDVGSWRVMLAAPAVPSRKVAAVLTADNGEQVLTGPPRKVATLLARAS